MITNVLPPFSWFTVYIRKWQQMVGDRDVARRCGRAIAERIDSGVTACISIRIWSNFTN